LVIDSRRYCRCQLACAVVHEPRLHQQPAQQRAALLADVSSAASPLDSSAGSGQIASTCLPRGNRLSPDGQHIGQRNDRTTPDASSANEPPVVFRSLAHRSSNGRMRLSSSSSRPRSRLAGAHTNRQRSASIWLRACGHTRDSITFVLGYRVQLFLIGAHPHHAAAMKQQLRTWSFSTEGSRQRETIFHQYVQNVPGVSLVGLLPAWQRHGSPSRPSRNS